MSGVTKEQGWKHRSEISQSHYNRTQVLINALTGQVGTGIEIRTGTSDLLIAGHELIRSSIARSPLDGDKSARRSPWQSRVFRIFVSAAVSLNQVSGPSWA